MMKSPIVHLIGMVAWWITALASINMGSAVAFGFDVFTSRFVMQNMPGMVEPMYYIIGIAGLVSLALAISHCVCVYRGTGTSHM